jgi:hypothetical protein
MTNNHIIVNSAVLLSNLAFDLRHYYNMLRSLSYYIVSIPTFALCDLPPHVLVASEKINVSARLQRLLVTSLIGFHRDTVYGKVKSRCALMETEFSGPT